jgi:hypothetical protein
LECRIKFRVSVLCQTDSLFGGAAMRRDAYDAIIRVYDAAGNVIETHEHAGDFKEW